MNHGRGNKQYRKDQQEWVELARETKMTRLEGTLMFSWSRRVVGVQSGEGAQHREWTIKAGRGSIIL